MIVNSITALTAQLFQGGFWHLPPYIFCYVTLKIKKKKTNQTKQRLKKNPNKPPQDNIFLNLISARCCGIH